MPSNKITSQAIRVAWYITLSANKGDPATEEYLTREKALYQCVEVEIDFLWIKGYLG